jgi:hypothetical protein
VRTGVMMLLPFSLVSQPMPDFSGFWRLNLERSTFRAQAPKEQNHWSLSADGQTLRMAHLDDDLAGQIAVLEAAPEAAMRFKTQ